MLVQCLTPKIDITWIAYRYKIVPGLQSCVRWLITAVQNGVTTQIMKVAMCAYVFAEARNVPLDANLSRWPNITLYKFDCTCFFYHSFHNLPCIIKHTTFKKEQGPKTVAGSWHFFCLYRKLYPVTPWGYRHCIAAFKWVGVGFFSLGFAEVKAVWLSKQLVQPCDV